jgi:drug/metabolite transporter (DMT)-like permease
MTGSLRVWLAFALLCSIWGSSYLFIRIGLRQLTPLSLVALRLAVGVLVIGVVVAVRREPLRLTWRQFQFLVILATVNTSLPFLLISWGEVTVPSGLASVLNSTVPIFSILLAGAILKDEPITLPRASGVILGFSGVVLLVSRDLLRSGDVWSGIAGQAAIVLASICYAIAAVFARRTLRGVPSMTIATWVLMISSGQTIFLSLIFSPPSVASFTFQTAFAVLWLGILGSGIAYILSFFILENWGASRYTFVAYMLPVVGLTLGAVFLQELIDWRILAGSLLVIAGIALASVARGQAKSEG